MIIDLLRHGALEGGHRYRGQVDDLLTVEGRRDMDRVWHKLKGEVEMIITSPLRRCSIPAYEWSRKTSTPCMTESWLREMHYGDWEGMTMNDIEITYPGMLKAWRNNPESTVIPNGEPLDVFLVRISEGWRTLLERYQGKHLLMVSHSGVMRALIAQTLCSSPLTMRRFSMPYACWSRVEVKKGDDTTLAFHHRDLSL